MKKLNKKQQEKFNLIKAYLSDPETVCDDIYTGDNDVTWIDWLKNIYLNAFGLFIIGKRAGRMERECIDPADLTRLFNAIKRNDEDFARWLLENDHVAPARMTEKELRSGKKFYFSNGDHMMDQGDDDVRQASVFYSDRLDSFFIEFNGAFIHSSKTFKSLENRLKKLMLKWYLKAGKLMESKWNNE